MKNSSNSFGSKLYKNWTALFVAWALMQGCASTNNRVNDVMSVNHDDLTPPRVSTKDSQNNLENYSDTNKTNIVLNWNPDTQSWNLLISNENSRLEIWLQDSESMWLVTSVEYANVWDKWWTLITTNFWDERQSYLVTWLYKWVDFSAKATAWYLRQDFEWVDIGQKYIWAEFLKDFSNIVENFRAWMYANATFTDSKTLSVTQVSRDVEWWKEITTTTTSFEWEDTRSAWFTFEYDYGNSSFDANFWHTNIWNWANNYWFWYTYNGWKIRPSIEYSRLDGDSFDSETYRGKIDYIISDWLSVWAAYERINSSSMDDNRFMITFTYTPGLKSYQNSRTYNHMNLTHTTWAREAMSTLYWQKETKVTTEFILDKSALDSKINEAWALDKNNYTPNSWSALSTALAAAVIINNDDNSTLEEVKTAFNNLNSAIDQLSEVADFSTLNSTISTAQWLNESDYTTTSWSNLQTSLTNAIQIRDNSNSTQTQVDQANTNLQSAISWLEWANTAPSQPNVSGDSTVTVWDAMNLTFSSTDAEWNSLTYRVVSWTIPAWTTFNSNGTLSWTTTTVQNGSFQVVANDGSLDSSAVTVNYDVEAAPVVNTAPSQPNVSGDSTVTVWDSMNLTFSSTDAEWNSLTYRVVSWTIPAWTTFNSNGTLSWTTTTVQSGSFQVVANDGSLDSSAVTVNYDVEAAPVVNTAPTTSNIVVTWDIIYDIDPLDLSIDIADDDLSKVTWTLNMWWYAIDDWLSTWSFSQNSWTGDSLKNITFTPSKYWYEETWWRYAREISVTITDSASGSTQTVILYQW